MKLGLSHITISPSSLQRLFQGVIRAQNIDSDVAQKIIRWISEQDTLSDHVQLELKAWEDKSYANFAGEACLRDVIRLVIGVAYLQGSSKNTSKPQLTLDPDLAWSLIKGALDNSVCKGQCFRGPQGFLAIHLCSLILEGGKTDELYRLHVWMPNDQRANTDFSVHSHQAFGQSWILAGEGEDIVYHVEAADELTATHCRYEVTQDFIVDQDGERRRVSSTLHNTGGLVKAAIATRNNHTRDMTYTMPAGSFHKSEVGAGKLHATLFMFDSQRGWKEDATVLGPMYADKHQNARIQTTFQPKDLKAAIEEAQEWEGVMLQAEIHAGRAEWEDALERIDYALRLCGNYSTLRTAPMYEALALVRLGSTYRRFGRYDKAREYMTKARKKMPESKHMVWLLGELGVVYRHNNSLAEAKLVLQEQYEAANRQDLPVEACRAIGNLGMVNYQLYQINHDEALLMHAIDQCTERVKTAEMVGNLTWALVGYSRLALCHIACGKPEEALLVAKKGLEASKASPDPTAVAFTRFFLGKAFLSNRQKEEALTQFDPVDPCTPAMAFCKEASEEHLDYLQQLIDNGADLDRVDEDGYSALDYALFGRHVGTQELIISGLQRQLGLVEAASRLMQSRAREGYRAIFQESFRPVLRQMDSKNGSTLQCMREVYARNLMGDPQRHEIFDELRSISYTDFCKAGRLPPFTDGLAQAQPCSDELNTPERHPTAPFLIFMSYR